MGSEFKLPNFYMNQNMQYGNQIAFNPSMYQNANAAIYGNYNLTLPQFNFAPMDFSTPMFNNNFGFYGNPSSGSSSSSSKTSAETEADKIAAERQKRNEDSKAKTQEKIKKETESTIFKSLGLTKEEEKVLLEEHSKTFEPKRKIFGEISTTIAFGAVMKNGGLVSHGWNSVKSIGRNSASSLMFRGNETLWKNSSNLMQEAYYQMHKAERRHLKGLGMLKKCYSDQTYKAMEDMMFDALQKGSPDEIAKVTESFKQINTNDGWLSTFIKRKRGKCLDSADDILNKIRSGNLTPEMQANITSGAAALTNSAKMTWGNAFNQAVGGKMGKFILIGSFLGEIGNIRAGFKKGKKSGWKQVFQSLVKAVANSGGYIAGETVGIMAGAKLGAMIGSVVPGLGTAIGAFTGVICGTIVSCVAGNLAKKAMGYNVCNEVKTQEVAQKEGGAEEILNTLLAQAQNGELKNEEAMRILSKYQEEIAAQAAAVQAAQAAQLEQQGIATV